MAAGVETSRAARRESPDNIVLPFGTVKSRMAGRIVRLGDAVDRVLTGHDYPDAVSQTLGEALALTDDLRRSAKVIQQAAGRVYEPIEYAAASVQRTS